MNIGLSMLQLYLLNRVYWAERWLKMLKNDHKYQALAEQLDKNQNTKYKWGQLMSPDEKFKTTAKRLVNFMIDTGMLKFDEKTGKWKRDEKWIEKFVKKSPGYKLHTDFTEQIPEMLNAPVALFLENSKKNSK